MAALRPYDPDEGPDAAEWLALGEDERVAAVRSWTARSESGIDVKVSNRHVYTVMLATVETQIAHGDELPVAATMARLVRLGMSRREAVHALATVLAETTYDAFYGEAADDPEVAYHAELAKLTPESWRNRFDDDLALPVF